MRIDYMHLLAVTIGLAVALKNKRFSIVLSDSCECAEGVPRPSPLSTGEREWERE